MKTKENSVNAINRVDILAGVVSLIKVVDKNDTVDEKATVISENGDKKVVALDIRKIIFEELDGEGIDVLYALSVKQEYAYKIMEPKQELQNNTLVIRNVWELGEVLHYAGVPKSVKDARIPQIAKTILSSKEVLSIRKHNAKLSSNGILDPRRVAEINTQAAGLLEFKKLDLPTKPQKIEKVYAKHFK